MPTHSIRSLKQAKADNRNFATVTAYDATFARLSDEAGIECVLVGDSLGNVIQGKNSTVPVTMDDMLYHTEIVARGVNNALLMADMPYMSYGMPDQAIANAAELMQSGAQIVKLEGTEWLTEIIHFLSERGIPVCGHLGLLPQSVNKTSGYRVQGKEKESAAEILTDARSYAEAGADILLLECVPAMLAKQITEAVDIPVIGIGAGAHTDSQVLVVYDLLGLSDHPPSFAKNYMASSNSVAEALSNFANEVREGAFPGDEHIIA